MKANAVELGTKRHIVPWGQSAWPARRANIQHLFTPARSYTHHCHWLMTHDCKTIKLSTLASFSPWIPLACGLVRHGICDKRMARFRPCTVRMQLSCRPVPIVPIVPMSPLSPLYPCLLDHLPVPKLKVSQLHLLRFWQIDMVPSQSSRISTPPNPPRPCRTARLWALRKAAP